MLLGNLHYCKFHEQQSCWMMVPKNGLNMNWIALIIHSLARLDYGCHVSEPKRYKMSLHQCCHGNVAFVRCTTKWIFHSRLYFHKTIVIQKHFWYRSNNSSGQRRRPNHICTLTLTSTNLYINPNMPKHNQWKPFAITEPSRFAGKSYSSAHNLGGLHNFTQHSFCSMLA